jgi:hypothetical protein
MEKIELKGLIAATIMVTIVTVSLISALNLSAISTFAQNMTGNKTASGGGSNATAGNSSSSSSSAAPKAATPAPSSAGPKY